MLLEITVLLGFAALLASVVGPDVGTGLFPKQKADEVGSPVDDIVPPGEPKEGEETDDEDKDEAKEELEDEPESPSTEEKKPAEPAGFDEGLLRHAESMGIPRAAASAFPNQEALQATLFRMQQAEQAPQPKAQAEFEKLKLDLEKLSEYGPEFKDVIGELVNKVNERLEKMHTGMAQVHSAEEARQRAVGNQNRAMFAAEFDKAIDGLDDEWAEVFDKGPGDKLAPDSEGRKNRDRVIEVMKDTVQGRLAQNKALPDFKDLVRSSVHSVFSGKAAGHARTNLSKQLKRNNGRLTARPTQKLPATRSSKPEDRANEKVAAKLKEFEGG